MNINQITLTHLARCQGRGEVVSQRKYTAQVNINQITLTHLAVALGEGSCFSAENTLPH